MKSTRKQPLPNIDSALQIIEAGIEKIAAEIGRERLSQDKPPRPRRQRAKASSRRAA